jgi:hypothetical protein
MSVSRIFLSVAMIVAMFMAVGCQSSGSAPAASVEPPQKAVVVTGNAGSYTVFVPSADKTHAETLSSTGGPVCADCKAAAEHYFLTGELVAKCPSCGATRTAVVTIPPVSHN